jgi:RNA polymerase sigma factor (sigma-70 family)
MSPLSTNALLGHLRGLAVAENTRQLPDQQLLERFVDRREKAAFEALFRRHGPLVWDVCRRVLHHYQDAEDAFQATFLVLARQAGSIRNPESVGSWLHGVAYHAALNVRKQAATRLRHEPQAPKRPPSDPLAEVTGRELLGILDHELLQLPERYRAPLILYYLEGKTRDQAARLLGWSLGTFKRRLHQARECLRGRLERRGLTLPAVLLPAGVLATTLSTNAACAALPATLAAATVKAALLSAAGGPATAGAFGPRVTALAQGGIKAMRTTTWKLALALFLIVGLVGAGLGLLASSPPAEPGEGNSKKVAKPAKASKVSQASRNTATKGKTAQTMTVTGRVLNAGGKPVAGAWIAVLAQAVFTNRLSGGGGLSQHQYLGQGKADAQGRFRLVVARTSRERHGTVTVLAGSPGHGFALVPLHPDAKEPKVEIRLPREQVLRGRLVDLQGKPAAGVRVQLTQVHGRLGKFYLYLTKQTAPKDLALWPKAAVTDAKGRFLLGGLGPDWTVSVETEHPRFAHHRFDLQPADRKGGKEILRSLTPARTIEGTVTYGDTHKPVPGARLLIVSRKASFNYDSEVWMEAQADAKGHFRINPYAGNFFAVSAFPPAGQPYLMVSKSIALPRPDVVKQKVHLALVRGILVKGKVTEKASGKPVAGAALKFQWRQGNNPFYRRELNDIYGQNQNSSLSRADGRFEVVILPGPGHLLVNGPTPEYLKTEITNHNLHGIPIYPNRRNYFDALVPLNLKPQKGPHRLEVTLRRGVTLTGKVVGPDGKPVAKAVMVCRTYIRYGSDLNGANTMKVTNGRFELPGCDPNKPTEIFFCNAKHKLGAVVKLSAKEVKGKPVTVRLKRCGTAKARLVDDKGKPLAKVRVVLEMVITRGVPSGYEFKVIGPSADIAFSSWFDPRGYPDLKTDAKGQITLPTLIPGATYWMFGKRSNREPFTLTKEFKAEAGKALNLGDITVKSMN